MEPVNYSVEVTLKSGHFHHYNAVKDVDRTYGFFVLIDVNKCSHFIAESEVVLLSQRAISGKASENG